MADILLSSPELSVLGGPSSVTVETDFGAPGNRGSLILFSNGNPNISGAISQSTQIYDMAINIDPTDSEYHYVYQYQLVDGNLEWVPQLSLSSAGVSFRSVVPLAAGVGNLDFPLANIAGIDGVASLTAENIIVQATPISTSPIALTIDSVSIFVDTDDIQKVRIPVRGYDILTSSSLTTVVANFTISIGNVYEPAIV